MPLVPAPDNSSDETEQSPLPSLSVLLVEDNPVNQQIAEAFLTKLGQTVHIALSGLQALDAMYSGAFDLVLMDVQMPEMDGISATPAIKLLDPEAARIPIIAMTANVSDEDRTACLEAGMEGVEIKPMPLSGQAAVIRCFALTQTDDRVDPDQRQSG
ncbi:response regulator [Breoghania sp.]|uniref:response regulator n=1 Tax=Breoghania sp. TaxID=2065378 RepID=UPI00262DD3EF|nr:response regulator [Breoghania sp.]MDJ0933034.1 response regulator [Breoghania sp.]